MHKVTTLCNSGSSTFCRYPRSFNVLPSGTNDIPIIDGDEASASFDIPYVGQIKSYLSRCGKNLIVVPSRPFPRNTILLYSKPNEFNHPLQTVQPVVKLDIKITAEALLVAPNERKLFLGGYIDKQHRTLTMYDVDLCGEEQSIVEVSSASMANRCSREFDRANHELRMFTSRESYPHVFLDCTLVVFMGKHMYVYDFSDTLVYRQRVCLLKYEPNILGSVTHACWFYEKQVLFVTSYGQVLIWDIESKSLSSVLTNVTQEEDDVIIGQIKNHKWNYTYVLKPEQWVVDLAVIDSNHKWHLLKSLNVWQLFYGGIDNRFHPVGIEYCVNPVSGDSVLLVDKDFTHDLLEVEVVEDMLEIEGRVVKWNQVALCFNLLDRQPNPYVLQYDDVEHNEVSTNLMVNWRSREVLIIDENGYLNGCRLPMDMLSLKSLVKQKILSLFNDREIASFDIPSSVKEYLLW